MHDRQHLISRRLEDWGLGTWTSTQVAGDASARKYLRLTNEQGDSRIVMDADPASCGPIAPFVAVAEHLTSLGLHAPAIYQADASLGLMALQDFGDALVSTIVATDPRLENRVYSSAIDVILTLQSAPPLPDLTILSPELGTDLVEEVWQWIGAQSERSECLTVLSEILAGSWKTTPVMSLRDYHADNLIRLETDPDIVTLGVLDFQDAVLAHPVYDLVSLLWDVRRDVSASTRQAGVMQYCRAKGLPADDVAKDIAAQGLQRDLRILGIFGRLAERDGKAQYLQFVPRVLSNLMEHLSHPSLADRGAPLRAALERKSNAA